MVQLLFFTYPRKKWLSLIHKNPHLSEGGGMGENTSKVSAQKKKEKADNN